MLSHPLLPKLRQLGLSGMALTLDNRCAQAAATNLTSLEFLALLLDDEIERRQQQRLRRRLGESGLDPGKSLAQFDFAALPQLNRGLILELATCAYVARGQNLLLCGPTGVGKSHLVNALGLEALKRNYSVYQRPLQRLLGELNAARADGSFSRRFNKLCDVDVLILDDFGLRPLTAQGAEDMYELICRRYERRPLFITSNRSLNELPEVFGDGLLASAALDRLTHHCQTVIIRAASYRQREHRKEEPVMIESSS
jgi:DNA replication protein DnaC